MDITKTPIITSTHPVTKPILDGTEYNRRHIELAERSTLALERIAVALEAEGKARRQIEAEEAARKAMAREERRDRLHKLIQHAPTLATLFTEIFGVQIKTDFPAAPESGTGARYDDECPR